MISFNVRSLTVTLCIAASTLSATKRCAAHDHTEQAKGMIPTADSIEIFEKRVKANPNDAGSWLVLGRLQLRLAKEADQFNAYSEAERSFEKVLQLNPESISGKSWRSVALLAMHRFEEAAEQARDAVNQSGRATSAMATLCDALTEMGNLDEAERVLAELKRQNESPPVLVRLARIAALRGNSHSAESNLVRAVEMHVHRGGTPEQLSWYQHRLGAFHLESGNLPQAKHWFEAALHSQHDDVHSVAALASVLARMGDEIEAVQLFEQVVPDHASPPVLSEYGDLLAKMGRSADAEKAWDLAEEIILDEAGRNDSRIAHAREAAVFLSNHDRQLDLAIKLARTDLEGRKDPAAYDTLAWALHQSGNSADAIPLMQTALQRKDHEASFHFHAGMIYHRLGNRDSATKHLRRCLQINEHFSIRDAAIARKTLEEIT